MAYIVGLAGPGLVGKSTTAKRTVLALCGLYGHINVDRYAFAQPIYEVASQLTGIPIDTLKDPVYKETEWNAVNAPMPCLIGWTPRKFLQKIGTECFRDNIGQSFWIESALRKVSEWDIAIMEDTRFPNEFHQCDMIIELHRKGIAYAENHISAMPPDQSLVNHHVEVYEGMSYNDLAKIIFHDFDNQWVP